METLLVGCMAIAILAFAFVLFAIGIAVFRR